MVAGTDEGDEATERSRDGFPSEGTEADPEGSLLGGDGTGRFVAPSGRADRAVLPEEGKWSAADAARHNVADSLHAAMV
jgi:hypothetical protein